MPVEVEGLVVSAGVFSVEETDILFVYEVKVKVTRETVVSVSVGKFSVDSSDVNGGLERSNELLGLASLVKDVKGEVKLPDDRDVDAISDEDSVTACIEDDISVREDEMAANVFVYEVVYRVLLSVPVKSSLVKSVADDGLGEMDSMELAMLLSSMV